MQRNDKSASVIKKYISDRRFQWFSLAEQNEQKYEQRTEIAVANLNSSWLNSIAFVNDISLIQSVNRSGSISLIRNEVNLIYRFKNGTLSMPEKMVELQDIIYGWSDEEDCGNPTDVVYIPPATVDDISDEETIDDDEMPTDRRIDLLTQEMPGSFEVEYSSGIDDETEPPVRKKKKGGPTGGKAETHTLLGDFGAPKWRKSVDIMYANETEAEVPYETVEEVVRKIGKHKKWMLVCFIFHLKFLAI